MSWLKLLRHDLTSGLLRPRYLAAILLFVIPSVQFVYASWSLGNTSYMDCLLLYFVGTKPPDEIIFNGLPPTQWLLLVGGCLFLNLDYPLGDLTRSGQQMMIRGRSRLSWYLSKTVWMLCACAVYLLAAMAAAAICTVLAGAKFSLQNTLQITQETFNSRPVIRPAWECLAVGVGLPWLTLAALCQLQMILCLVSKPAVAFSATVCLFILSVFWNSPLALGVGTMSMRSDVFTGVGHSMMEVAVPTVAYLLIFIIAGALIFRRANILGQEE